MPSTSPTMIILHICLLILWSCDELSSTANIEVGEDSLITDMNFPDMEPNSTCLWINDGVCDEPHNCALGSDQEDCSSICKAEEIPEALNAVCAWRASISSPVSTYGLGSQGSGGAYGHLADLILTPSGEAAHRVVPRHYRAYVPRSYTPTVPIPLLFMLPGHRVAVDPLADYTQLIATADTEGFIVVFVEQEVRSADQRWAWWTDWRWNQNPDASTHPDLIFLETLTESFKMKYNIDESRVYVSGHSRGASMALIAALERPDLFAAAVSQSGFTEFGYETRIRSRATNQLKPSILLLHGDLDPDVCIDCRPNGRCAVSGRQCGSIYGSDGLMELFSEAGWDDTNLRYYRLNNVTHRWQPQLNSSIWAWLKTHPKTDSLQEQKVAHSLLWPSKATVPVENDKRSHAPVLNDVGMISFSDSSFEMGNPVEAPNPYGDGWFMDQTPINLIHLAAFAIDQNEVTVSEYAQFLNHVGLAMHYHPMMPIQVDEEGYQPYASTEALPISGVNWEDARSYCAWRGKRLPSEEEWEFIATGGGRRHFPWNTEGGPHCQRAVGFMNGAQCSADVKPIGTHFAGQSPEGLNDLIGNVAEWTSSRYAPYIGNEDQGAWLPTPEPLYAVRGGGLFNSGIFLKSRTRWSATANARGQALGFRCAQDQTTSDLYGQYRGSIGEPSRSVAEESPLSNAKLWGEVIAEGLVTPYDYSSWGEGYLVTERDNGHVTYVTDNQDHEIWIEDLDQPTFIARQNDSLLIATSGELLSWNDGVSAQVTILTSPIEALVADEREAYWISDGQLYHRVGEESGVIITEVGPGSRLKLTNQFLLIITTQPVNRDQASLMVIDRNTEEVDIRLRSEDLSNGLLIYDADFRSLSTLTVTLRFDSWPHFGRVCDLELIAGELNCFSDSPPQINEITWVNDKLFWSTKRAIIKLFDYSDGSSYLVASQWHNPRSLTKINGSLVWLDFNAGSLWQLRGE